MAKKRALITGVNGQDGSYLAERLLAEDYEVFGLVRRVGLETRHHTFDREGLTHGEDVVAPPVERREHQSVALARPALIGGNSWGSAIISRFTWPRGHNFRAHPFRVTPVSRSRSC